MRKSLIFAAGFATAFALPITRAFIVGVQIAISEAKANQEQAKAIAQYPQTVN